MGWRIRNRLQIAGEEGDTMRRFLWLMLVVFILGALTPQAPISSEASPQTDELRSGG